MGVVKGVRRVFKEIRCRHDYRTQKTRTHQLGHVRIEKCFLCDKVRVLRFLIFTSKYRSYEDILSDQFLRAELERDSHKSSQVPQISGRVTRVHNRSRVTEVR